MFSEFDFWKFVGGLAIFLLGMNQLEDGIEKLSGRSFKLFLRKHTRNRFKSIASGTFVAAIMQSSSVVSLMVLAFVGVGIIPLKNALGIIFGSNLGTTFTGWIVAIFGFKMDIEGFSLPLVAIGGIATMLFSGRKNLRNWGFVILGFGLLFLGLNYMKVSIEELSAHLDLSAYANLSPLVFLIIGLIFTAVIQSSSATMVIVLSAMNARIIEIEPALGMIIGANMGTTLTVIFGALGGVPSKKRVALGHVIFNVTTGVAAYALLNPLTSLITNTLLISDPLIVIVTFHSFFNLLGVLLFIPLMGVLAKFLEKRFERKMVLEGRFVHEVTTDVHDEAILAIRKEARYLLESVIILLLRIQGLKRLAGDTLSKEARNRVLAARVTFALAYHRIKQLQGEILSFFMDLQKEPLTEDQIQSLEPIMNSVRNSIHSLKEMKDIRKNLREFKESTNEGIIGFTKSFKNHQKKFYHHMLVHILADRGEGQTPRFEELAGMQAQNLENYNRNLTATYEGFTKEDLKEIDMSTILNVNREIYLSNKSLVWSMKDLWLDAEAAREFENIPSLH